ncbi:MAG: RrF2 family transcriptional regulator [Phycisphaerae bacterium]
MVYSVGCEYGIRALITLARRVPQGHYCLLRDILDGENLPRHFVGKIFQTLVREKILSSAKGRGGGFAIRRSPDEITLRQIVQAIDGVSPRKRCFLGFTDCDDDQPCPVHSPCSEMTEQIDRLLDTTTLAQLVSLLEEREAAQRGKPR